jgi:hypothetical protein
MSLSQEILSLRPLDWFVVGLTTAVTLLGMLLPKIGNLIGRLLLGEDPLLVRWKTAREARKAHRAHRKAARQAAKTAQAGRSATSQES